MEKARCLGVTIENYLARCLWQPKLYDPILFIYYYFYYYFFTPGLESYLVLPDQMGKQKWSKCLPST
jgi:hypothetical protein